MIIALQMLILFRESVLAILNGWLPPFFKELVRHWSEKDLVPLQDEIEDQVYSDYDEDFGVVFFPPVYVQRYAAICDCLMDKRWFGRLEKVLNIGKHYDIHFMKYLTEVSGVTQILGLDTAYSLNCTCEMLDVSFNDYTTWDKPMQITLLQGDAIDPDYRLIGCDAVIAIEMIQKLLPHELDRLVHNIFGFVKPWVAMFTTPNADFNCLIKKLDKNGLRQPDHYFEWTREQLHDWCTNIVNRYPEYTVTSRGVGPGPAGTSHYGCFSQLILFTSKHYKKEMELNVDSLALVSHSKQSPFNGKAIVVSVYSLAECNGNVKVLLITFLELPDPELVSEFDWPALLPSSVLSSQTILQRLLDTRSSELICQQSSPGSSQSSIPAPVNIIQFEDRTVQCSLDAEFGKSFVMYNEEEIYETLLPRVRIENNVYEIGDVARSLNNTMHDVKQFSKTTQYLMNKNRNNSKDVTDEILQLTEKLTSKINLRRSDKLWNNVNWGENVPYWNQYYKVVGVYNFPYEGRSEDEEILEVLSEEINKLFNNHIGDRNLGIPVETLMNAVKHITDDFERVIMLMEDSGYELEGDTVVYTAVDTSETSHDGDYGSNSDYDSLSNASSSGQDFNGRVLNRTLGRKVKVLRRMLPREDDMKEAIALVICRLKRVALNARQSRQGPSRSKWLQTKLLDLLTLTEKSILRRKLRRIEHVPPKWLGYDTGYEAAGHLSRIRAEDDSAMKIVQKYATMFRMSQENNSRTDVTQLDTEDDLSIIPAQDSDLSLSPNVTLDEQQIDSDRDWEEKDMSIYQEETSQENIKQSDGIPPKPSEHRGKSNHRSAKKRKRSSSSICRKKSGHSPTLITPKRSLINTFSYKALGKRTVRVTKPDIVMSRFAYDNTLDCFDKIRKKMGPTFVLSIPPKPIPESIVELCHPDLHQKTVEPILKKENLWEDFLETPIAATEHSHKIEIVDQSKTVVVALQRTIGTDPDVDAVINEHELRFSDLMGLLGQSSLDHINRSSPVSTEEVDASKPAVLGFTEFAANQFVEIVTQDGRELITFRQTVGTETELDIDACEQQLRSSKLSSSPNNAGSFEKIPTLTGHMDSQECFPYGFTEFAANQFVEIVTQDGRELITFRQTVGTETELDIDACEQQLRSSKLSSSPNNAGSFEKIPTLTGHMDSQECFPYGFTEFAANPVVEIVTQDGRELITFRQTVGTETELDIDACEQELRSSKLSSSPNDAGSFEKIPTLTGHMDSQEFFLYDINEPTTSKGVRHNCHVSMDVQCGTEGQISATTSFTFPLSSYGPALELKDDYADVRGFQTDCVTSTNDIPKPSQRMLPPWMKFVGIKIKDSDHQIDDSISGKEAEPAIDIDPRVTLPYNIMVVETLHTNQLVEYSNTVDSNVKKKTSNYRTKIKSPVLYGRNKWNEMKTKDCNRDVTRYLHVPKGVRSQLSYGGVHVHSYKSLQVSEDVIYQGEWQKCRRKSNVKKPDQSDKYKYIRKKNPQKIKFYKDDRQSPVSTIVIRNTKANKMKEYAMKIQMQKQLASKKQQAIKRRLEIRPVAKVSPKSTVSYSKTTREKSSKPIQSPRKTRFAQQTTLKDNSAPNNKKVYIPPYLEKMIKRQQLSKIPITKKVKTVSLPNPNVNNEPAELKVENLVSALLKVSVDPPKDLSYVVYRNETTTSNCSTAVDTLPVTAKPSSKVNILRPKLSNRSHNSSAYSSPGSATTVLKPTMTNKNPLKSNRQPIQSSIKSSDGKLVSRIKKLANSMFAKKLPTNLANVTNITTASQPSLKHTSDVNLVLDGANNTASSEGSSKTVLKTSENKNGPSIDDKPSENKSDPSIDDKPSENKNGPSIDDKPSENQNEPSIDDKPSENKNGPSIDDKGKLGLDITHQTELITPDVIKITSPLISSELKTYSSTTVIRNQSATKMNTQKPVVISKLLVSLGEHPVINWDSKDRPSPISNTHETKDDDNIHVEIKQLFEEILHTLSTVDIVDQKASENIISVGSGTYETISSFHQSYDDQSLGSLTQSFTDFSIKLQATENGYVPLPSSNSDEVKPKSKETISITQKPITEYTYSTFSVNTQASRLVLRQIPDCVNLVDSETGSCAAANIVNRRAASEELLMSGRSSESFVSCVLEEEASVPSWLYNVNQQASSSFSSGRHAVPAEVPEAIPEQEYDVNGNELTVHGAGAGDGYGIHSDQSQDSSGQGTSFSSSESSREQSDSVVVDPASFLATYEPVGEGPSSAVIAELDEDSTETSNVAESENQTASRPLNRTPRIPRNTHRVSLPASDADISSNDTDVASDN